MERVMIGLWRGALPLLAAGPAAAAPVDAIAANWPALAALVTVALLLALGARAL